MRAQAPLFAMLLVVMALVGCLSDDAGSGTPPADADDERGPGTNQTPRDAPVTEAPPEAPPGESAPVAITQDFSFTDCPEGIAVFVREPAAYQAVLPPGFTTRDFAGLFGLPEETGQAAATINRIECPATELEGGPWGVGLVYIFVEPPTLEPDPGLDPVDLDFFVSELYMTEGVLYELLSTAGVPVVSSTGTVVVTAPPDGLPSVATTTADDAGPVFSFTMTAEAPTAFTSKLRLWSPTPDGVAFVEYDVVDSPYRTGPVTGCALRAGSVAAHVMGVTECAPHSASGLHFPGQSATATFRFLPGVHVVAAG